MSAHTAYGLIGRANICVFLSAAWFSGSKFGAGAGVVVLIAVVAAFVTSFCAMRSNAIEKRKDEGRTV